MDLLQSKMYEIGNEVKRYEGQNGWLVGVNERCEGLLVKYCYDGAERLRTGESEDRVIESQRAEIEFEVGMLEKEFGEVKSVIHESYKEMGETTVGQRTPMRSGYGALEKYYAGLGTFDTLALLGWFEELLKNLEIVQERTRQSAEQSTAVGTPLRTSMVGESREQMTMEDEIIGPDDSNPKGNHFH
jgi:hypothetical protein